MSKRLDELPIRQTKSIGVSFYSIASNSVIPAQAGIHFYIGNILHHGWIPAFAEMTTPAFCFA